MTKTEASSTTPAASISTFESLVAKGAGSRVEARQCLRTLLLRHTKGYMETDTLEEIIARVSQAATEPVAVVLILRASSIPGFLDAPDKTNQLQRHVTSICERLHNDFVSFLRIDKAEQTFEKYQALVSLHARVCAIVSGLISPYGDLSALVASQKEVVGALNHSIVRSYGSLFHVNEVRSSVELILGKLRQIDALASTLPRDIEDYHHAVSTAQRDLKQLDSFVVQMFLGSFVPTCERLLVDFLKAKRTRFSASIAPGTGSNGIISKRYPLGQSGRVMTIDLPLRNGGPGVATDVIATAVVGSEDVVLDTESANLGNVSPGSFSVSFKIMVVRPVESFEVLLDVKWGEIAGPARKTAMFTFGVQAQRKDIDWTRWQYANPYSTDVAEGEQFVGRVDRLRELSARLLSKPMESFYITGQKRVGKTSLALAAIERAQQNSQGSLHSIYVLWGAVAHADPMVSLKQLGRSIDREVRSKLPYKSGADASLYDGSLAALVSLFAEAARAIPNDRFVILIDEFDEIHPELFLSGNLAETFFANLRALSRCKNVCLVLIGGENMPFVMDRQGQKLNNLARIDLSYFSRESEWSDYQKLVQAPAADLLTWQDDAFSELFNLTNGNPYFTKLVCSAVLRQAFDERDCDITSIEIHNAADRNLGSLGTNSFAHLWQDGIPKRADEREIDVTRRLRVLVAIARCIRKGIPSTISNIASNRATQAIPESEIPPVLHDFARRKVLIETEVGYVFVLPIFQKWLADVGLSQLIANSVGEQLASLALERENAATVTAAEIVTLSRTWPTYRGRVVGADDIRAWLQQVESVFDQRILFRLLQRTLLVGEPFIRERLSTAHSIVRRSLPEFIIRKRGDKRKDLVLTYVDGEGKSGAYYAAVYAEENGISADSVLSPSDFGKRFDDYVARYGEVKAVVVIDDVAATGQSLAANLISFGNANREKLAKLAIRAVTLFSTKVAEPVIHEAIASLRHSDFEFRSCQTLQEEHFAFPTTPGAWESAEQEERAKSLVRDLGSDIYRDRPLGFGDLGLLLVLPNTVPNNTLPILHTPSRSASNWSPLFPRIVN